MRRRRAIDIPDFLDRPAPPAYSSSGLAARTVFLRNVASAWQNAGDNDTAAKIQRDAERQAKHFVQPT